MNNRLRSLTFIACSMVVAVMLFGCSQPPSDKVIKETMTKEHRGADEGRTTDFKYDVFQIKERGKFNKDGKYWPFRVYIKGTYTWFEYHKQFDRIVDVKVSKDDYGNWTIR